MNIHKYFEELSPDNPPDFVHDYVERYNKRPGRLGVMYGALCKVLIEYDIIKETSSKPPYLEAGIELRNRYWRGE